MPPLEELLAQSSLFAELSPGELGALARAAEKLEFAPEEEIFSMGSAADGLYLVASGRVKVVAASLEGKEVILATLGAGSFFGEMALLDDEPRSASVVAQLPSVVYRVRREVFHRLLEAHPGLARALLRELSRRLRRANSRLEDLVSLDVVGRLARYFIQLAREHGQLLGNGWVAVRRPTHQDIAASIGTTRETVTRLMAELGSRGVVLSEGKMCYLREEALREEGV